MVDLWWVEIRSSLINFIGDYFEGSTQRRKTGADNLVCGVWLYKVLCDQKR